MEMTTILNLEQKITINIQSNMSRNSTTLKNALKISAGSEYFKRLFNITTAELLLILESAHDCVASKSYFIYIPYVQLIYNPNQFYYIFR